MPAPGEYYAWWKLQLHRVYTSQESSLQVPHSFFPAFSHICHQCLDLLISWPHYFTFSVSACTFFYFDASCTLFQIHLPKILLKLCHSEKRHLNSGCCLQSTVICFWWLSVWSLSRNRPKG